MKVYIYWVLAKKKKKKTSLKFQPTSVRGPYHPRRRAPPL